MMKLILTEIKYYKPVYIAMAMPLAIFTLFGIADVKVITKLLFIDKYFWSITIGLGSYLLIYGMQANRLKEERDRLHNSLPIKLNYNSSSKFLFGISPIIFIAVYLKLLVFIFPADWLVFINRVYAQLGLFFIFLGALSILYEIVKFNSKLRPAFTGLIVFSTFIIIAILSWGLIYSLTQSLIKPLPIGGDEFYFYIWALVLTGVSSLIYIKRKSYVA